MGFINARVEKNSGGGDGDGNQFMNGADASKVFDLGQGPQDVARASFEQLNEISRRAEGSRMTFGDNSGSMAAMANQMQSASNMAAQGMANAGMTNPGMSNAASMSTAAGMTNTSTSMPSSATMQSQTSMGPTPPTNAAAAAIGNKPMQQMSREELLGRVEDLQRERPDQQPFTHSGFLPMLNNQMYEQQRKEEEHKGLQVITLGHLVPREGEYQQQQQQQGQAMPQQSQQQAQNQQQQQMAQMNMGPYSPPANYHGPTPSTSSSSSMAVSSPGSKSLRVRRSTYVPGWAVPPRVLLVDDDAVNLRLSKKFLQVFGCMIDVAVDGVGAVDKMNLEKYDLVLMVSLTAEKRGVGADTDGRTL